MTQNDSALNVLNVSDVTWRDDFLPPGDGSDVDKFISSENYSTLKFWSLLLDFKLYYVNANQVGLN